MKTSSSDPAIHREREHRMVQHVERLLGDERLRVDTVKGSRPVVGLMRDVTKRDRAVEVKRAMIEMGLHDRDLLAAMPVGESLEVTLSQQAWWFFKKVVGRLHVISASPTRQLLAGSGDEVGPMDTGELAKVLAGIPPPMNGVPVTVVVMSTSGFTMDAHELADRRADRTVVLVEPNEAGGWTVTGPIETRSLADLFDPEAEDEKRQRVREFVEENAYDLGASGLAADRIAARTRLSPQLVEAELKNYANAHPGLQAKRLDGRMVLFREGSAPLSMSGSSASGAGYAGGSEMPLLQRLKALFARKGDNEQKISYLAERRTLLSQQRDRAYEEMSVQEQQEAQLRRQFKEAAGAITKKRVTTQLLQLRKDIERRQQLLAVLNQQINVVSTHLHNLELVKQGDVAQLPDTEEMTADAVKAEEMLAELEASNELAGSTGTLAMSGLTKEEQELYEELEREARGDQPEVATDKIELDTVEQPAEPQKQKAPASNASSARTTPAKAPPIPTGQRQGTRRSEPEPG